MQLMNFAIFHHRPNLLVLDEPTNHLDIESVAALGDSLKVFNGGVVLVSHDERLIGSVCSQCWVCTRYPPDIKDVPLKSSRVFILEGGLKAYRKAVQKQLAVDLTTK